MGFQFIFQKLYSFIVSFCTISAQFSIYVFFSIIDLLCARSFHCLHNIFKFENLPVSAPNGDRIPYRVAPRYDSPSPIHSSDSDDTFNNKESWWFMVEWVVCRWKFYARYQRYRRIVRWLSALRLLPGRVEALELAIARFV